MKYKVIRGNGEWLVVHIHNNTVADAFQTRGDANRYAALWNGEDDYDDGTSPDGSGYDPDDD